MTIARRGDRVGTSLVTDRRSQQALTARAKHDALTALRRGLAEYLLTAIDADTEEGRAIRLESVLWGWADFEVRGRFPAAYVTQSGAVTYNQTTTSRGSTLKRADAGEASLDVVADFSATLQVHLYAKDPVQRSALVRGLEQAFYPADWLDALRLKLDFYHGAFASYDLRTINYEDSPESAAGMFRKAIVEVAASLPLVVTRSAKAAAEGRATVTASPTVDLA